MIRQLAVVAVAAFIWAKMEVEIEGEGGWAKNLPTWRLENHPLLKFLMNDRPLTGYHLWAFLFVFFIFHLPLLWMGAWDWRVECRILGSVALFWVIEDILWFLTNPHYGWRRYKQRDIWWHKTWRWGIPSDHWGLLFMAAVFLACSAL